MAYSCQDLIDAQSAFITRLKAGTAIEVLERLSQSPWHRDSRIRLGKGPPSSRYG